MRYAVGVGAGKNPIADVMLGYLSDADLHMYIIIRIYNCIVNVYIAGFKMYIHFQIQKESNIRQDKLT